MVTPIDHDRGLTRGFEDLTGGRRGFEFGAIELDDVTIAYRHGGDRDAARPAVLLVHGWPQSGYAYRKLVPHLMNDHAVVIPDYRGAGASSIADGGYDKPTMAGDLLRLMTHLGYECFHVVGHDIGMMIAAHMRHIAPERLSTATLIDAVVPGTPTFDRAVASGAVWHFGFHAEVDLATTLTAGHLRTYFDRFFDRDTADGGSLTEEDRRHYVTLYQDADRLRAGYRVYAAFDEDADRYRETGSDTATGVPTMVICGGASLGELAESNAREFGAATCHVLADTGHYVAEESPGTLAKCLRNFWEQSVP